MNLIVSKSRRDSFQPPSSHDVEFDRLLDQIDSIRHITSKQEYARIERWIQKLQKPVKYIAWKRNRNFYAQLLRNQIYEGRLTRPFDVDPPKFSNLPSLPGWQVRQLMRKGHDLEDTKRWKMIVSTQKKRKSVSKKKKVSIFSPDRQVKIKFSHGTPLRPIVNRMNEDEQRLIHDSFVDSDDTFRKDGSFKRMNSLDKSLSDESIHEEELRDTRPRDARSRNARSRDLRDTRDTRDDLERTNNGKDSIHSKRSEPTMEFSKLTIPDSFSHQPNQTSDSMDQINHLQKLLTKERELRKDTQEEVQRYQGLLLEEQNRCRQLEKQMNHYKAEAIEAMKKSFNQDAQFMQFLKEYSQQTGLLVS